jgi:hypothetical protein
MKHDYAAEQADSKTEQSDSCDSMSGDAGSVSGIRGHRQRRPRVAARRRDHLQSNGIQAVKNDLSSIQGRSVQPRQPGPDPGHRLIRRGRGRAQGPEQRGERHHLGQRPGDTINNEAQLTSDTASNYTTQHCG